jgi:hypothetical protein
MAKRTAREAWKAIEELAIEDEMDRILALSDAQLDAELVDAGFDPKEQADKGAAMATALLEHRAEQAWQAAAQDKSDRVGARFASRGPRGEKLSHDELLAAITRARLDPRLAQPVEVMFRNRPTEKATDEELEAMLEEIEGLAEHDDHDE